MTIDFARYLNPAQLEAAQTVDGPVLVIAGAGSGKTRTIVYRLAYMVEQGVRPQSILLLTFTRKAARQMLERAGTLLNQGLGHVQGGTFHAFAYSVLRRFPRPEATGQASILDRPDAEALIREAKERLGLGKGDRSYPRARTILELIGKSRNKELALHDILSREAFHLSPYADDFQKIAASYAELKKGHNLLDYEDLLFELDALLVTSEEAREAVAARFHYIMVDEYQDTNLVQARLVKRLAGARNSVMAVGDDAQSIYAFRGANVQNILDFPHIFPGTRIVKLERNYRSTQPILDLTNRILEQSAAQFRKELYSERLEGPLPQLVRPLSDLTQARAVADTVRELLDEYPPHEIAVLFRAGYQSFHVEVQLANLGIRFQKFGGLKYTEAAHIKDALSYLRILRNPADLPAWQRCLAHIKGIGAKTATRFYEALFSGDRMALQTFAERWPDVKLLLARLDELRHRELKPGALLESILEWYTPLMEAAHPDDYPRRTLELEQLQQIASTYDELDVFLADLNLDAPAVPGVAPEAGDSLVTLSTIHSAKGLEWSAALVIDLVEERFPSRQAMQKAEDYEEERRLLYVACTRAKDRLYLFAPATLFKRGNDISEPATLSPFVREISGRYWEEWRENYSGGITRRPDQSAAPRPPVMGRPTHRPLAQPGAVHPGPPGAAPLPPREETKHPPLSQNLCFCTHKIFGRGKIVAALPPDKYRVNFPGFGLKVILAAYLELENG